MKHYSVRGKGKNVNKWGREAKCDIENESEDTHCNYLNAMSATKGS